MKSLWVPPSGKEDVILHLAVGPLPRRGEIQFFSFCSKNCSWIFFTWLFLVKCRNCPRRAQNPDVSLRPTKLPDFISSFFSGSWRNTMALVLLLVQMWDRCWDASYTPTEESWEMCSDMFRTKRLFHIVILDLDTSYLCIDREIAVLSLPLFFFSSMCISIFD